MKRTSILLGAAAILALGAISAPAKAQVDPVGGSGAILGWTVVEAGFMLAGYEAMYKSDGLTAGERTCRNGYHGIGFLKPDSCVNGHSAGLPTPPVGYNASHPSATPFKSAPY